MIKPIICTGFGWLKEMESIKGLNIQLPRSRLRHKRASIFRQWKLWAAALLFLNVVFWSFQIARYSGLHPGQYVNETGSAIVSSVFDGVIAGPIVRVFNNVADKTSPAADAATQPKPNAQKLAAENKPEKLADDPQKLASELILSWHTAWSRRDSWSYLNAYSSYYAPPGASREQWVRQRQEMIENKRFIYIKTQDMSASFNGLLLVATFRMDYLSDSYKSSSVKELTFQKEGDRWLIVKEVSKG